MEEGFKSTCEAPDLSGLWVDLDDLGRAAITSLDAPIVIHPCWRSVVAHWPHERWSRWRRYAGEFLDDLAEGRAVAVADIKAAELAAFDLLRTDGGPTR